MMTNDLLGFATLIRTVNHEDAASIADALTRCILDPDALPLEEMLGLKRPDMTWKRSDIRRLIVEMADHFNGQLAKIGGSPLSKTSVASYIIKEAKRCEPAYKAYEQAKVLPAHEPDRSLVRLMATHGGKRRHDGSLLYTPDMQTMASYLDGA